MIKEIVKQLQQRSLENQRRVESKVAREKIKFLLEPFCSGKKDPKSLTNEATSILFRDILTNLRMLEETPDVITAIEKLTSRPKIQTLRQILLDLSDDNNTQSPRILHPIDNRPRHQ